MLYVLDSEIILVTVADIRSNSKNFGDLFYYNDMSKRLFIINQNLINEWHYNDFVELFRMQTKSMVKEYCLKFDKDNFQDGTKIFELKLDLDLEEYQSSFAKYNASSSIQKMQALSHLITFYYIFKYGTQQLRRQFGYDDKEIKSLYKIVDQVINNEILMFCKNDWGRDEIEKSRFMLTIKIFFRVGMKDSSDLDSLCYIYSDFNFKVTRAMISGNYKDLFKVENDIIDSLYFLKKIGEDYDMNFTDGYVAQIVKAQTYFLFHRYCKLCEGDSSKLTNNFSQDYVKYKYLYDEYIISEGSAKFIRLRQLIQLHYDMKYLVKGLNDDV